LETLFRVAGRAPEEVATYVGLSLIENIRKMVEYNRHIIF